MVILYGFGQYMEIVMKKYYIPQKEIELIIDNGLSKRNVYIGKFKVASFQQYLADKEHYVSNQFVIGARVRFNEIKTQLIEQANVQEENIMFVDEWIEDVGRMKNEYINEEAEKSSRDYINQLISEVGEIPERALKEAKVLKNRNEVCKYISQNTIVAEVGVAYGDFSKIILNEILPKKFYAVDIFNDKVKGFWGENTLENITHYNWYKREFKDYIDRNVLEMCQGISWECLEKFPDNYFDYVYVDAGHDYGSVKNDIEVLKRVVKNKGIIQFNDYTHYAWYGIVPAVHELIKDTDSIVLFYCLSLTGMDDIVIQLIK